MCEVKKRSIVIRGRKTSITLEDPFWCAFKSLAHERRQSRGELVREIDGGRGASNLSSAIRLFVLEHYIQRSQRQPRFTARGQHEIPEGP